MSDKRFDEHDLHRAFSELGRRAVAAGKLVELAVYGGAALVLTFPARAATKDVDAVMRSDAAWVREAVADMAEENGWPTGWLNDGVKGYLSDQDRQPAAHALFRSYPDENEPGLRVFVASPHYLFAMKCLAMRVSGLDETADRSDILSLAAALGIRRASDAIEMVRRFYPDSRIPPKSRFGLEEIFGASGTDPEAGVP